MPDECFSRHPARAHAACIPIAWVPAQPMAELVRVRDYTCDCEETYYELCQVSGIRFIRRLSRGGGRLIVEESRRGRAPEIDNLWEKLLSGAAR